MSMAEYYENQMEPGYNTPTNGCMAIALIIVGMLMGLLYYYNC